MDDIDRELHQLIDDYEAEPLGPIYPTTPTAGLSTEPLSEADRELYEAAWGVA